MLAREGACKSVYFWRFHYSTLSLGHAWVCACVCSGNLQVECGKSSFHHTEQQCSPVHPLELMEKQEGDFFFPADQSLEGRRKERWFLSLPSSLPSFISSFQAMLFGILSSYATSCHLLLHILSSPAPLPILHPSSLRLEPSIWGFSFQSPISLCKDGVNWLLQELLAWTKFGWISKRPLLFSAALPNSVSFFAWEHRSSLRL